MHAIQKPMLCASSRILVLDPHFGCRPPQSLVADKRFLSCRCIDINERHQPASERYESPSACDRTKTPALAAGWRTVRECLEPIRCSHKQSAGSRSSTSELEGSISEWRQRMHASPLQPPNRSAGQSTLRESYGTFKILRIYTQIKVSQSRRRRISVRRALQKCLH